MNHDILISRLESRIGINGKVLSWFKSYLSGRSQHVIVNGALSDKFQHDCGVPQGHVSAHYYSIYLQVALFDVIDRHLAEVHCYADESQLFLSFCPNSSASQDTAVEAMKRCIIDIR